jgi:hypothetical protein
MGSIDVNAQHSNPFTSRFICIFLIPSAKKYNTNWGQAAEEGSPARGGTSAGNELPRRDMLRFREGERAKRMRKIWLEKFRPFL